MLARPGEGTRSQSCTELRTDARQLPHHPQKRGLSYSPRHGPTKRVPRRQGDSCAHASSQSERGPTEPAATDCAGPCPRGASSARKQQCTQRRNWTRKSEDPAYPLAWVPTTPPHSCRRRSAEAAGQHCSAPLRAGTDAPGRHAKCTCPLSNWRTSGREADDRDNKTKSAHACVPRSTAPSLTSVARGCRALSLQARSRKHAHRKTRKPCTPRASYHTARKHRVPAYLPAGCCGWRSAGHKPRNVPRYAWMANCNRLSIPAANFRKHPPWGSNPRPQG